MLPTAAHRQDYKAFSWLMIDAGMLSFLWVVPPHGWAGGCVLYKKAGQGSHREQDCKYHFLHGLCFSSWMNYQLLGVQNLSWALVAHTFNPSTQEAEAGRSLCEFKASLIDIESSRTGSKATQRNPVSNKQTNEFKIYLDSVSTYRKEVDESLWV